MLTACTRKSTNNLGSLGKTASSCARFSRGQAGFQPLAAARALLTHTELDARTVVNEALKISAGIDIYTNDHITVEELSS